MNLHGSTSDRRKAVWGAEAYLARPGFVLAFGASAFGRRNADVKRAADTIAAPERLRAELASERTSSTTS